MKRPFPVSSLLFLLLVVSPVLLLSSCIEIRQTIRLNPDGSGDTELELAIQSQWVQQLTPKVKSDIPAGWSLIGEKDTDGKHMIIFGRPFRAITEINDKNMEYIFVSDRGTVLTGSFSLDIRQIANSQMPFPYELNVRMPGVITSTNGTKISSREVRWNLQGFNQGTVLSVRSSESVFSSPVIRIASLIAACLAVLFILATVLWKRRKKDPSTPPNVSSSSSIPQTGPFCTRCGTRNSPEARFCINCGIRIEY